MTPEQLISAIPAALDEAERLARAAAETAGDTWWHRATLVSYDDIVDDDVKLVVRDGERLRVVEFDDDMVAHIARHDPAAVLRLVAAMREIVDLHHSQPASGFDADGWEHHGYGCAVCYFADNYPCPTIRALARGLGIVPEETP